MSLRIFIIHVLRVSTTNHIFLHLMLDPTKIFILFIYSLCKFCFFHFVPDWVHLHVSPVLHINFSDDSLRWFLFHFLSLASITPSLRTLVKFLLNSFTLRFSSTLRDVYLFHVLAAHSGFQSARLKVYKLESSYLIKLMLSFSRIYFYLGSYH